MKLFDAKTGGKIRAVVWIVVAVATQVAEAVTELDEAGWVLSVPALITILGNWTTVGDKAD